MATTTATTTAATTSGQRSLRPFAHAAPTLLAVAAWSSCSLVVDAHNAQQQVQPPPVEVGDVDVDRALLALERITSFGNRAPGFNAELASDLAARFNEAGVADVDIEDFAIPLFTAGASSVEVGPAGSSTAVVHLVNQFSGTGAASGTLVDLKNARTVDASAAGRIVLIDALQTSSIRAQYEVARSSGAVGVLFNSNVDGGLLRQRNVWNSEREGQVIGPIPAAAIGKEDALRLRALVQAGNAPLVRMQMDNGFEWGSGHSVVARIAGRVHPERVLVVNAHIDSWFNGVADDAQAVAALLELAHVFSAHPPAYGLELVAFDAEETGLLGSADFLRRRTPGAEQRYIGAITLEMLAPVDVETAVLGLDPLQRDAPDAAWSRIVDDSGLAELFPARLGASDVMTAFNGEVPLDEKNFWGRGIPGFFTVVTYGPYHTEDDTLDATDELRYDAVLRGLVHAIARLQDEPPERLVVAPASFIELVLAAPLQPAAGQPLHGEVVATQRDAAVDNADVVVTLHDEAGTALLKEATVTPLGDGHYAFDADIAMQEGTRYVVSVSAVTSNGAGRTWLRVGTAAAGASDTTP